MSKMKELSLHQQAMVDLLQQHFMDGGEKAKALIVLIHDGEGMALDNIGNDKRAARIARDLAEMLCDGEGENE